MTIPDALKEVEEHDEKTEERMRSMHKGKAFLTVVMGNRKVSSSEDSWAMLGI